MEEHIQVMTTTDQREAAQRIATEVVEKRLAACAQVVGPITSIFRWQGAVESSEEWLCFIKTRRAQYSALEKCIKELHSYSVPEIIAMPIVEGNPDYLAWLRKETGDSNQR